jgi:PmbA protein
MADGNGIELVAVRAPYRERLNQATATARDLLTHSPSERWEVYAKGSFTREVAVVPATGLEVIHSEETGLGVRVSLAGHTGFAAAAGLDPAATRSAVEGALANRVPSPLDPIPPAPLLGTTKVPHKPLLPPQGWAAWAADQLVHSLQVHDSQLRLLRAVFQEGAYAWLLTTGDDFVASFEGAACSLLIEVAVGGNAAGTWREWFPITNPEAFDPPAVAAQIANRILLTRVPAMVDTGLRDVIFHSEVTAQLLAALVPFFLATHEDSDALPKMLSRDGQLASHCLTLIDHRADHTAPLFGPCDGEGLPARRTLLIENGIPRHRIASYRDAVLCGEQPRAGALRLSYRDYPVSGIASLQVVAEQGHRASDMLADAERALYLLRPLGPVVIDPQSDTIQVVGSGVWLEGGRVRGWQPVVELRVGIGQLLRRIEAVGTDLAWYQTERGLIRAPSLLVRRQNVVG